MVASARDTFQIKTIIEMYGRGYNMRISMLQAHVSGKLYVSEL
jgi:hypothetical protein